MADLDRVLPNRLLLGIAAVLWMALVCLLAFGCGDSGRDHEILHVVRGTWIVRELRVYEVKRGRYPTALSDALRGDSEPTDRWGRPFRYRSRDETPRIWVHTRTPASFTSSPIVSPDVFFPVEP